MRVEMADIAVCGMYVEGEEEGEEWGVEEWDGEQRVEEEQEWDGEQRVEEESWLERRRQTRREKKKF